MTDPLMKAVERAKSPARNTVALNDAAQDHLHPALTHTIQAMGWLHKTVEKAGFQFGRPNLRQTIDFARDELRSALQELDAFEAAVYPAAIIPTDSTFTDEENPEQVRA
jgi:hypothetical protein